MKPCVPKSSNDEILDWCALDGFESGVFPIGLDWWALDRLESEVVPFSLIIALDAGSAAEFGNDL